MRSITTGLVALAISVLPLVASAADEDDEGMRAIAVQNRQHSMTHEFTAWVGTLPLDAFTKGLTFSGGYTLHFTDFIGWEIGQYTFSYGINTDLYSELDNLRVGPTPFEVVKQYVTSNLLIKPMYGKFALFNRSLIFSEIFLAIGGGYGWMTITSRPIVDVGLGLRIYAGKYLSFRFDIRDYMFFNKDTLDNELWIALGVALSID